MISTQSRADPEQARLALARKHLRGICAHHAGFGQVLEEGLRSAPDGSARQHVVADTALGLWRKSVSDAQLGASDDRALYWGRLALREAIIENVSEPARIGLLESAERHSRGLTDIGFPATAQYRILITGFDPFHLNQDIAQSNPSGLAALSLHGATLAHGERRAHVQAALIPVRFDDFDAGLIEAFFAEQYHKSQPSMVVTTSMGRDGFDLERFPGRRRSTESRDNRNVLTGATPSDPLVPLLAGTPLRGPEFIEFSLPAHAMIRAEGEWAIRDNRKVATLERGAIEAASLAELAGETAVRGSGGGYLSNEISYRSVLLRNNLGRTFPIGHIHTPSVASHQQDRAGRIVAQIRRMLEQAIGVL